MIRRLLPVLTVTSLLIAGGCRSKQPAGLTKEDRANLAWASETWERAANAKDFGTMASLYAEDAVLMPPNADPVRGRSAIQDYLTAFPPYADMQVSPAEVEGRGDLAYAWGGFTMTVTPPSGAPILERGKYMEVWRRLPDGYWRITHDIFNSNLPAGGAAPATQPANK
jgi:uncharacterized protein (TIGR02246 family)